MGELLLEQPSAQGQRRDQPRAPDARSSMTATLKELVGDRYYGSRLKRLGRLSGLAWYRRAGRSPASSATDRVAHASREALV
jgi:hypothetical protein